MDDPFSWVIVAVAGGVVGSIFSSLKECLLRYSVPRLEALARLRGVQARVARFQETEESVVFSATILKLLSNLVLVFGLYQSSQALPHILPVIVGLIIGGFLLLLVVNELLPKILWAALGAERIVLSSLGLMLLVSRLLEPVHRMIEGLYGLVLRAGGKSIEEVNTRQITDDILSAAEEGERGGLLQEEGAEMIESIIEFQDALVREIMTPRTRIVGLEIGTPVDKVIPTAIADGHSRFPVYRETIDDIVGILYVKDLLRYWDRRHEELRLDQVLRPPVFIPEGKRLSDLFRQFRESKIHIAIVLDEYGGTAGLITLEDIVEEIVGDIEDEFDREEAGAVERIGEHEVLVAASLHIDELNHELDLHIPESEEFDTIGGFLSSVMGRIPSVGDDYVHENLRFTVEDADQRRIHRVRISIEENGSGFPGAETAPAPAENGS